MFRKTFYSLLALFIIAVPLVFVYAAPPTPGPIQIDNPLKFNSIQALVLETVKVATTIGFYIAVFFIIYSGFLFVKARGNPKEIEDAKKTFMWTVIGTAVLLGANVVARVIQGTITQIQARDIPAEHIKNV